MLQVVLYQPEIPPNTGNVIRLCANTGAHLHLIEPMGFALNDAKLKRAGLDYHEWASVKIHPNLNALIEAQPNTRLIACSTKGKTSYCDFNYQPGDALLFGPETRGLPADILVSNTVAEVVRIPMQANSRSLNLSNSVAIILYEAWRQLGFKF